MRSKFWFLVGESLKKKIKNKWFLVANVVLLLLLVGIFNADKIVAYFGGDFQNTKEIIVMDTTEKSFPIFKEKLELANTSFDFGFSLSITSTMDSIDTLKEEIKGTDKILIFIEPSISYLKASVVSDAYLDTSLYQLIVQSLNATKMEVAIHSTDIDIEEYHHITSNIEIERILLDNEKTSEEEISKTVLSVVFPTLILPFFILVVFLVQMIGTEINEEKSSRSMEIIISSVSPKTHFFSKVAAGNIFVLFQAFLLLVYALIAFIVRIVLGGGNFSFASSSGMGDFFSTLMNRGILDKLYYFIPIALILFVLSFLAYSLLAGILASMTVSMEDFNQIQAPIMFICMTGYYLSIMSSMFSGSIFIRVLSYLPFLSCLLSPALLLTGQITIIDSLISIGLLLLLNYFFVQRGLKVYKIGILNYSTDKMWQKIMRAVKNGKE